MTIAHVFHAVSHLVICCFMQRYRPRGCRAALRLISVAGGSFCFYDQRAPCLTNLIHVRLRSLPLKVPHSVTYMIPIVPLMVIIREALAYPYARAV